MYDPWISGFRTLIVVRRAYRHRLGKAQVATVRSERGLIGPSHM